MTRGTMSVPDLLCALEVRWSSLFDVPVNVLGFRVVAEGGQRVLAVAFGDELLTAPLVSDSSDVTPAVRNLDAQMLSRFVVH
jgi:hypothetical protein